MESFVTVIGSVVGMVCMVVTTRIAIANHRRGGESDPGEKAPAKSVPRVFRARVFRAGPLMVALGLTVTLTIGLLVWQLNAGDTEVESSADRLLAHLAGPETKNCKPDGPLATSNASLTCGLRGLVGGEVAISHFGSDDDLAQAVRQRIAEVGIGRGSCATQRVAWERTYQGTLICDYGQEGVPAVLEWSRRDSLVFVRVTAEAGIAPTRLYTWWSGQSIGSPNNNRLPYPDSRERFILLRSGLRQSQCQRNRQYSESEAAVICEVPGPDVLVLAYYGTSEALKRSFYFTHLSGGVCETWWEPGPDGPRTVEEPQLQAYRVHGEVVGKRACYVDEGTDNATVEWINKNSRIYGWAQNEGSDGTLEGLVAWWRETGRFLTD